MEKHRGPRMVSLFLKQRESLCITFFKFLIGIRTIKQNIGRSSECREINPSSHQICNVTLELWLQFNSFLQFKSVAHVIQFQSVIHLQRVPF